MTRFKVPLEKIKFPGTRGSNGNPPAREANTITINFASSPPRSCIKVYGAVLRVKLMSPIILIHGNDSNGDFFVRQGFPLGLSLMLWDNSIDLPTSLRDKNGLALSGGIPDQPNADLARLVRSFGVDSIHIVTHSKGGLDVREYLQRFYPSRRFVCSGGSQQGRDCDMDHPCEGDAVTCRPSFDILSVITLSAPHNGSILADLDIARGMAAARAADVQYNGFPNMKMRITGLVPSNPGRPSLTTTDCAAFNTTNVDMLPTDIVYGAVAGDADKNYDGVIHDLELQGLHAESGILQALSYVFLDDNAVTFGYQLLHNTLSIRLRYENRLINGYRFLIGVIDGTDGAAYGNDVAVTTRSALGTGSWARKSSHNALLTGNSGRNHASVADYGVAGLVANWIVDVERARGDLR